MQNHTENMETTQEKTGLIPFGTSSGVEKIAERQFLAFLSLFKLRASLYHFSTAFSLKNNPTVFLQPMKRLNISVLNRLKKISGRYHQGKKKRKKKKA